MPLVFVHGVDTRDGQPYRASRRAKREFFERHLRGALIGGKRLDPACLDDNNVSFPYWGHLGASFRLGMASLPPRKGEVLGSVPDFVVFQPALATWADLALDTMNDRDGLLQLARRASFSDAVAVINHAVIQTALDDQSGEFVAAASSYAVRNTSPDWLDDVKSDGQFIDRLITEVVSSRPSEPAETLGAFSAIGDAVHAAAVGLKDAARDAAKGAFDGLATAASPYAVARWRGAINGVFGRFTGDVFHYLNGRQDGDTPGKIGAVVVNALERAVAAGGPLVVIGHSLGGVIAFDLLSGYCKDLVVDLFVSIGSQISHFEEMSLLRGSEEGSTERAQKPDNIRRWINVFDPVDILAYACEGVFRGVSDLRHESRTHSLHAHSAYFEQDAFYTRLRKRIDA